MTRNCFLLLLIGMPVFGFGQAAEQVDMKKKLKAIANGYFMAYNEHNVDKILLFYADDAVSIDHNLNHTLEGKEEFRRVANDAFNGRSRIYKNLHFKIFGMEQNGYQLTVRGEMQHIEWKEGYPENWKFTAEIDFNEEGKIVKQVDYIDYPADVLKYRNK